MYYSQNLPNLVILDLGGNPVATSADNYRLFVIYHLKCLKALDGTAIVSNTTNIHCQIYMLPMLCFILAINNYKDKYEMSKLFVVYARV